MSKFSSKETGDFDNYFINDQSFIDDYLRPNSLWLWGSNSYSQLGLSTTTHRSSPVQITNTGIWRSASIKFLHAAGIKDDGTLWFWGDNYFGQLGLSTTIDKLIPTENIVSDTDWKFVSLAYGSSIVLKNDGTLWTCGLNTHEQIGRKVDTKVPYLATELTQGVWYEDGYNLNDGTNNEHLGAVNASNELWMWGSNTYGQLGDGTRTIRSSASQIGANTTWKQISFGRYHTAAIKTDGTLWTWGSNSFGQLGQSNLTARSSPVQVGTGTDWKQVSCGELHTAAVKTGGSLWTWGGGTLGVLGNSLISTWRLSPVQTITAGTTWNQVSCGLHFTAAVKTDGTLWLWGANSYGQLGRSDRVHRSTPIQTLLGGTDWSQVSCGCTHFAAVKTTGQLFSCGNNITAALGDSTVVNKSYPIQIIGADTTYSKVIATKYNSAAIKTDGTLWIWGQKGNYLCASSDRSGTGNFSIPNEICFQGTDWYHIYFANTSAVGIKTNGDLYTWGNYTADPELLIQSDINANTSVLVQTNYNTPTWSQISSGVYFHTGIKSDGTLWTWGSNAIYQLGTSIIWAIHSPVQTLAGGSNWKMVSAGNYFAAAIKTDGTLWAWGYNGDGQLGDSTTTSNMSPKQTLAGGSNWTKLTCGDSFITAIKTDGTLWSWGSNSYGQLGDGTRTHRSSPIQIGTNTNWKHVNGGDNHIVAIKTDGTLWAWGDNSFGQLGDSTTTSSSSPIQIGTLANWKQINAGHHSSLAIQYMTE